MALGQNSSAVPAGASKYWPNAACVRRPPAAPHGPRSAAAPAPPGRPAAHRQHQHFVSCHSAPADTLTQHLKRLWPLVGDLSSRAAMVLHAQEPGSAGQIDSSKLLMAACLPAGAAAHVAAPSRAAASLRAPPPPPTAAACPATRRGARRGAGAGQPGPPTHSPCMTIPARWRRLKTRGATSELWLCPIGR